MRTFSKMIGTLATALCVVAGASAASAATQGEKFGDWTVACEADAKICHLVQRFVTKEDNRTLLEVAISMIPQPDGSKKPKMVVIAPLGIFLPPQLTLQVDQQQAVKLPFLQCFPNGCRTLIDLEAQGLQKLKAGTTAKFTYMLPNGKEMSFPVSLKGFTAGFESISK